MRIGSRTVNQNTGLEEYSSAQFSGLGDGVAQALGRFGEAATGMATFLAEKQYRDRRSKADLARIEWQGSAERQIFESRTNVAPGASGFTNATHKNLRKSWEEFLAKTDVPEEDRDEYEAYFKAFQEEQTSNALTFEFEESNRYIGEEISKQTDKAAEALRADTSLFLTKQEEIAVLIDQSALPPIAKEELKKQAANKLSRVVFEQETMSAQENDTPVGPTDGSTAVAPGLSGAQRGFLNGVSRPESRGNYRIRYTPSGGTTFDDLSRHPAIMEPTADGRMSSAAGRYQITVTTWNNAIRQMRAAGYPIDGTFSEVNQDRVAWFISEQAYSSLTGRDLYEDIHSGDPVLLRQVFDALGAQGEYATDYEGNPRDPLFQGFRGEEAFQNFYKDVTGQAGLPPNPDAAAPDPFTDPRFANLPYDVKAAYAAAAKDVWNDPRFGAFTEDEKAAYHREALARQKKKQEEAVKAQEDSERAIELELEKIARQGDIGFSAAIEEAMKVIKNPERLARLDKLAEDDRKARSQVGQVEGALASRTALPSSQANEMLENYSRATGLQEEVDANGGEDAIYNVYDRLGSLPKGVVDTLLAKANGGDPTSRAFGMSVLSALYLKNPGALSSLLSDEAMSSVMAMASIQEYSPSAEVAAARYAATQTPEFKAQRATRKKEIDKALEDITPDVIFGEMTTFLDRNLSLFGGGPSLPKTPEQAALLTYEFQQAFSRNYVLLGDEELAKDAAAKELSTVWAANPATGEFMKYSPALPQYQLESDTQGFDWIEPRVRSSIGAPPDSLISLIGDLQTNADFQQSGAPTYWAVPVMPDGRVLPAVRVPLKKPEDVSAEDRVNASEQDLYTERRALIRASNTAPPERQPEIKARIAEINSELASRNETERRARQEAYVRQLERRLRELSRTPRSPEAPIGFGNFISEPLKRFTNYRTEQTYKNLLRVYQQARKDLND